MDYELEQQNEVEALQSIYPDECEIITGDYPQSFSVLVKSALDDAEDDSEVECKVVVQFTPKYPEEAPEIIVSSEELDEEELPEAIAQIDAQVQENLGMAMIFLVISSLQEYLDNLVSSRKTEAQILAEEAHRRDEEELRKKLEGTTVTVETFMAWKKAFDAERLKKTNVVVTKAPKKPTGREQFLADANLGISDIALIEQEGDVEIDESLFEDLDDLALEDISDDEEP